MILRNKDLITIETYDKDEIERLFKKGFVNIYDDMKRITLQAPSKEKYPGSVKKKSTRSTKKKRSTS
jgi:hypothetical protein